MKYLAFAMGLAFVWCICIGLDLDVLTSIGFGGLYSMWFSFMSAIFERVI